MTTDPRGCQEVECPAKKQEMAAAKFCAKCGRALHPDVKKTDDPLIGEVIAQRYRILRMIGRGGMGVVYKVEHIVMGKIMAMKLLHAHVNSRQHAVKRFRQEIKIVSRLSHVNTISVFDCGVTNDGSLFIVMEYLRGTDLEQLLQHHHYIGCIRAARIARQVCASLAEAHELGVIHRDIKPANIVILRDRGAEDFVKVLDFGIAKLLEPSQNMVTEIGLVVGTPYYMAPEQAMGLTHLTPSCDIYSLGVVLFEAVTGRLPFLGETTADYIQAHLSVEPPRPSLVSLFQPIDPEMDAIILQALQKDERRRFSSIETMQAALDQYIQSALTRSRSEASLPPAASGILESGDMTPPRSNPAFVGQRPPEEDASPSPSMPTLADAESLSEVGEAVVMLEEPVIQLPRITQTPDAQPLPPPNAPPIPSLELLAAPYSEPPEEAVATRADWERIERRWRRWHRLRTWGLSLFLLLTAFGGSAYIAYTQWKKYQTTSLPPTPLEHEREDNNTILRANLIPLDRWVTGELGRRITATSSDRDWFSFILPEGQETTISVILQPPPSLDVELGLYKLRKRVEGSTIFKDPVEILSINNQRRGGEEQLRRYRLKGGRYYLLVREMLVEGEMPQEEKGVYRLRVQRHEAEKEAEIEPNDAFGQASPAEIDQTTTAYHDRLRDTDFFVFSLPEASRRYRLRYQGVEGVDAEFALLDAEGQPLRSSFRKGSLKKEGEVIRYTDLFFSSGGKTYLRILNTSGFSTAKPYTIHLKRR